MGHIGATGRLRLKCLIRELSKGLSISKRAQHLQKTSDEGNIVCPFLECCVEERQCPLNIGSIASVAFIFPVRSGFQVVNSCSEVVNLFQTICTFIKGSRRAWAHSLTRNDWHFVDNSWVEVPSLDASKAYMPFKFSVAGKAYFISLNFGM